jgi:acetate kinase
MERVAKQLGSLPLFRSFPPVELEQLVERSRLQAFASQEVIISFGQPGRFLGIILDGEAEAVVTNELGERQRIGLLQVGDFLGEISLLTGEPTNADVIALKKCQILLIPQETFSTFLTTNPEALRVMAKTITERLRWRATNEPAQARLADAWRKLPDPYGLELSTAVPMKVLVINSGVSSLKFDYFDTGREEDNLEGVVERIGSEDSRLVVSSDRRRFVKDLGSVDHVQAFQAMLDLLTDSDRGVLGEPGELAAVGHRVVHGGDRYSSATIVDEEVIGHIDRLSSLAPLHNPLNLLAIKESMRLMLGVPQVAVFDTSFHQKMPKQAYLYGLPYEYHELDGIRRYGFHGISHNWAALQAAATLRQNFRELKIITCHLGEGTSLCAIDHGRSVDTSMGFTPLEGLIMSTRSGDLDPAIVLHLMREKNLSLDRVDEILNRESGLKGLSGVSGDFRELEDAAARGDHRSVLAIQTYCYRIRKYIGAYISALGGLDALVFTGGIGEGSAWVRSLACQGLSYMGIQVSDALNRAVPSNPREVADISDERSWVKVLVVPTDEGRMIARETIRAVGYQNVAQVIERQREKTIPIEVSAHHAHLSVEDVQALWGPGYELTHRLDLSQPGQFACEEALDLVGPRGRVERVRVLGPPRSQTQVEISMTEEFKLGIKAPIRASGDLAGSPGISLEGPAGSCDIPQGVICAARHIHMSPEDALSFGLKDRDICMVRVEGERTLIFGDVLVRVNPDYRLSMHIDTDEANAANIRTGMVGHLVSIQDRR